MTWPPPAAPPCPVCATPFVCSECGEPCMIVDRCFYAHDPPLCRKPDDQPLLCAGCYVKKAEAKEGA